MGNVWLAATLSMLHVLGITAAMGGLFARARFLRGPLDDAGQRRVLGADTVSGIGAGVLILSGLVRAFGGVEKGVAFYTHNGLFHVKMTLLVLLLALEVMPMVALIRWRSARRRGAAPDLGGAKRLAIVTDVETLLGLLIIVVAPLMARGVWLLGGAP